MHSDHLASVTSGAALQSQYAIRRSHGSMKQVYQTQSATFSINGLSFLPFYPPKNSRRIEKEIDRHEFTSRSVC